MVSEGMFNIRELYYYSSALTLELATLIGAPGGSTTNKKIGCFFYDSYTEGIHQYILRFIHTHTYAYIIYI